MRAAPLPAARLRALPHARPSRRSLVGAALALALLAGGWAWLRDSSLVAVERVTITGLSGPGSAPIRAALRDAATDMTTLHVRLDRLRAAVRPYPLVRDLRAGADFPHGLRIEIVPREPVAAVLVDGRRTPVAADGAVLRGAVAGADLPVLPVRTPPGGDRIVDRATLRAVALLAAAPQALRARVSKVFTGPRGLTVRLREGPALYFATAERLAAKWAAAASVLADAEAAGATYVDVRIPERPAAGGVEDPAAAAAAPTPAPAPAAAAPTPATGQP